MSNTHHRLPVSNKENPLVFLDISVDGVPTERMEIELFADVVPITAENFRALCTGEKGKGQTTGKPLHYKGTVFHSIHRGFFAQGGDISGEPDGRGTEESIYGGYFKDENFKLRHSEPGMLSMGNRGPDTNGSRFYITLRPQHILDGFHVVFGKVIRGKSTLYRINEMGTSGGQPSGVVQITDCGELSQDEGKMKPLKRASSSEEQVKEHMGEREKPRKYSPSAGLLQISDSGETTEDKKHNLMESDLGQKVSNKENPCVFLDISVDGVPTERMEIELFADVVPITAENFRALCTGEKGKGQTTGKPLHYKGTVFHSIDRGFFAQGGDISGEPDGRGGESIYGGYFKDENFKLRHSESGMLSMGNRGPDTNGSRFYITLRPQHLLDGFHVVFGKVIRGKSTLCRINEMGTSGGQPSGVVQITDCGELSQDKGKMKVPLKRASSSDEQVKEHRDERETLRKYSPSAGLLQISDSGETTEDKKNNLMESDLGNMKKSLKRASSADERVKEHSDEWEKRRKYSSSEGLLQISDGGEISEDKKNNVMESDQDGRFPREQQTDWIVDAICKIAGTVDDSIMELRQQIHWMRESVCEIAKAADVHLPDCPSPRQRPSELISILGFLTTNQAKYQED